MKRVLPITLLARAVITGALAVTATVALAHGEAKPRHGGIVRTAHDLDFELVSRAGGVVLHIIDHGRPLPTEGMQGTITILTGATKAEARLRPGEAGTLVADGLTLPAGATVVAAFTDAGGRARTVRFALK